MNNTTQQQQDNKNLKSISIRCNELEKKIKFYSSSKNLNVINKEICSLLDDLDTLHECTKEYYQFWMDCHIKLQNLSKKINKIIKLRPVVTLTCTCILGTLILYIIK